MSCVGKTSSRFIPTGLIHICIIAVSPCSHHTDIEVHKLKLGENNEEQLKSDPLKIHWELPLVATLIHTRKYRRI